MNGEAERSAPAFTDVRSKMSAVAHCVLNQNARIDTCATAPAVFPRCSRPCGRRSVPAVSLPGTRFPWNGQARAGLFFLGRLVSARERRGLRLRPDDCSRGERIADRACRGPRVPDQGVPEVRFQGSGGVGILASPTCGVGLKHDKGLDEADGAFIEELRKAFDEARPNLPIRGLNDLEPDENAALIEELDALLTRD